MRSSRQAALVALAMPLIMVLIIMLTRLPDVDAQRARQAGPGGLSAKFRGNNCVTCHATISEPLALSAHFYQWRGSRHEAAGIGCDKCHGGDPQAKQAAAAHRGVAPPAQPTGSLHRQNQSATCGACHREVTEAFVQSEHYRQLRNSAEGPVCATCHGHMASAVIYWPPETAKLCASCHRSGTDSAGLPARAQDLISAFTRADEILEWGGFLIESNPGRRAQLRAEIDDLTRLKTTLSEAKREFHRFNLEASRTSADRVFTDGYRLKEAIWKKIPSRRSHQGNRSEPTRDQTERQ